MPIALRKSLIASFLAASCGGAWMAWDAFEDHLAEVRKGSIRHLDPNPSRTTATNEVVTSKTIGENGIDERALKDGSGNRIDYNLRDKDDYEATISHPNDLAQYREAKEAWKKFQTLPGTSTQKFQLLFQAVCSDAFIHDPKIDWTSFTMNLRAYSEAAIYEMESEIAAYPNDTDSNRIRYRIILNALAEVGRGYNGLLNPTWGEEHFPRFDQKKIYDFVSGRESMNSHEKIETPSP